MSDGSEFDEFFEGAGGDFAPTAKFTNDTGPEGRTQVGGKIVGTILSMNKQDQKDFSTGNPILDDKGEPKKELKIVLQTDYRDWDKAAKVPLDEDKNPKPASEDDGRRAIYVRGWMTGAIGDAVRKATGKGGGPRIGAKLGVKVTELVPTDKGNPYPKYEAVYEAPAEGAFFAESDAKAEAKEAEAPTAPAPAPQAPAYEEPPF